MGITTLTAAGTELRFFWLPDELARIEVLREHLSPAERDARRSEESVLSRGLLRQLLAEKLGCEPGEVQLRQAAGGRPELKSPGLAPLQFSVSHAGQLLVIALASERIGVDIERAERRVNLEQVRDQLLHPDERRRLSRLPQRLRGRAFLRSWAAKEAYLKATGDGMRVDPGSFDAAALRPRVTRFRFRRGDLRWVGALYSAGARVSR